jgi:tRNA pseudouridine55 synthase
MARKRKGRPVHGWVALDKPLTLGSTPAVSRVRRLFDAQKAGHAGTLDPLATGLLPIALGQATKTVPFLMDSAKTYRFTVAWGVSTDSFDAEGAEVARSDVRPTPEQVADALPPFVGRIDQVPPAFSAILVNGERSYDLARAGQAVELQARSVEIHGLRVTDAPDPDQVEIEMDCGKGVYVRSLARDLAAVLGAEGHVSALRRTRVGLFDEARAVTLAQLEALVYEGRGLEALLPVSTALDGIPAHAVTDEDAFRLRQGRAIVLLPRQVDALTPRLGEDRIVSAMSGDQVVALCELRAGRLNPVRVLHPDAGD